MADARKDIERFIRQQLSRNRDTKLGCFILRSAQVGSKGSEVETFEIPEDISIDTVGIFADEILSRAQADADALGGKPVRYNLVAAEVGRKDGSRYAFRLRGEADDDEHDSGEEPADAKGMLAQLMRHNEALMRMALMTAGQANQILAKRLDQAEQSNLKMIEQRQEYLATLEEAKSLQHERDQQMLLTSGQEERKAEMFKKLEMLLPVIINKISGKEILPDGQHGDVFAKLAESLQPEQLHQIANYLTQEQQLLLLTLIKAAREKQPNGVASS